MTDDFFDQYDADFKANNWSGTTHAAPMLQDPGGALDAYFNKLKQRPYNPVSNQAQMIQRLSSPGYGNSPLRPGGGGAVGAFQPAGPPQRFSTNILGDAVGAASDTPLGRAFLGTPGDQRGGTIGPGIATVPVNFQNFATYAREGTLSLITSAMGHHYQQPAGDPYQKPAGPVNNDNIFENMSQLDFEGVLDNVIDGANVVGDAINAPIVAFANMMRYNAAHSRAQGIADLFRSGSTIGDPIMRITAGFDQSKFDWASIAQKAAEHGISSTDMAAELWDLSPATVEAIRANPDMSDEQISNLIQHEPFSYDPGVNLIAELTVNLAPMLAGAWAVRTAAGALRGLSVLGKLAEGETLDSLGLLGRPIQTAERLGSWSLQKAWRVYDSKPFQIGGAVLGLTPKGLYIGAGVRFGEWALKQTAAITGNDNAVAMMDDWLWEMPLSNNPGLMLMDAFATHPLRIAKETKRAVAARLAGREIGTDPVTTGRLSSIQDMDLETLHGRIGERLEWSRDDLERLFGPDSATKMTERDLKNGLIYVAEQVLRQRDEARARYIAPEAGIVDRNQAFWEEYGAGAVKLLQDELSGKGHAISDAIKDEFWTRAKVIDASAAGVEGGIGPYDGTVALQKFASWIRFNNLVRDVVDEATTAALRPDINREFVTQYRAEIAKRYKPNEAVSARDLNVLQTYVPSLALDESGILKGRRNVPHVTRRRLEAMLDSAERKQQQADLTMLQPRTEKVPAIAPEDVGNVSRIATAFKLRADTVRLLEGATEGDISGLGVVPGDLAAVLAREYRMTESSIRRDPASAWDRAVEWYTNMRDSSYQRGEAIDALQRFKRFTENAKGMTDATDVEAIRRIGEAIQNPYSEKELAANPALRSIAAERDAALSQFVDQMSAWLDSPLRKLRVEQLPDGARIMLPTDGFGRGDVAVVEGLVAEFQRWGGELPEEQAAIINDPSLHPLEKVEALRAAVDNGMPAAPAAVTRLRDLGTLEGEYGPIFEDVYGPDAEINSKSVATLTNDVANHADQLQSLREQARGLAGLVDRAPAAALSQELKTFYANAEALGSMKIGKGNVTIANWRSLPIEPAGIRSAQGETIRASRLVSIDSRLAQRRAIAERYTRLSDRATNLVGKQLAEAEYDFAPEPVGRFPTRKAALAEAKRFQEAGIATKVMKVGTRWHLFQGELTPEAAAAVAEAPTIKSTLPAAPARAVTDDRGNFKPPPQYKTEPGYLYRFVTDNRAGIRWKVGEFASTEAQGMYAGPQSTLIRTVDDGTWSQPAGGVNAAINRTATHEIHPSQVEYLTADGTWQPVGPHPVQQALEAAQAKRARAEQLATTGTAFEWPRTDGKGTVVVSEDTRPGSAGWRVTFTDPEAGPTGHIEAATLPDAIMEAGTLADITKDPTWAPRTPGVESAPAAPVEPASVVEDLTVTHPADAARVAADEAASAATSPDATPPPQPPIGGLVDTYPTTGAYADPAAVLADWRPGLEGYRREVADPSTPTVRRHFLESQGIPNLEAGIRVFEERLRAQLEPEVMAAREQMASQPAPEPPSAPEAAPVAQDTTDHMQAAVNRYAEAERPTYEAVQPAHDAYKAARDAYGRIRGEEPRAKGTEVQKNATREAHAARVHEAYVAEQKASAEVSRLMADEPLPTNPVKPSDLDPRLDQADREGHVYEPGEAWKSIRDRVLKLPPEQRPKYIITANDGYRAPKAVGGWDGDVPLDPNGKPIRGMGTMETKESSFRPATLFDLAGNGLSLSPGDVIAREGYLREALLGPRPEAQAAIAEFIRSWRRWQEGEGTTKALTVPPMKTEELVQRIEAAYADTPIQPRRLGSYYREAPAREAARQAAQAALPPEQATFDMTAEPPPPPIVEQISQQEAAAAAEHDAFQQEEAARQAAFNEHADHYEQARAVPVVETPVEPSAPAGAGQIAARWRDAIQTYQRLSAKRGELGGPPRKNAPAAAHKAWQDEATRQGIDLSEAAKAIRAIEQEPGAAVDIARDAAAATHSLDEFVWHNTAAIRDFLKGLGFDFTFDKGEGTARVRMKSPDGPSFFGIGAEGVRGDAWGAQQDALRKYIAWVDGGRQRGEASLAQHSEAGYRGVDQQHTLGPDTYANGPKGGDKIGGNPSYKVRSVETDGTLRLAESGPNWKRAPITKSLEPGTTLAYNKAGGVWHVVEAPPPELGLTEPARTPEQIAQGQLTFGEGEAAPVTPPAVQPITATEIGAFEDTLAKSAKFAEDEAAKYRASDQKKALAKLRKQQAAATLETDPKVIARVARQIKEAEDRLALYDKPDQAKSWYQTYTVIQGIQHAIGSGRWDARLVAGVARLDNKAMIALIDRIKADNPDITVGDVPRWFNEHFDEFVPPDGAPAAHPAPTEVTFLDPQDNRTPIRSRVVLVDAADVLTSDQIGYPANLQPRSRAIRASSDAQIAEYARDLQPDKLLGTTEGASGMPIVTPEGAVLAGNGRTAAIRMAEPGVYSRYKVRLQAEAPKYGFDVAAVNGMERPMLVRELVDVDPETQTRLAWQLNEMPLGDLAPSLASAITREDIRQLRVGDAQALDEAIRSPANQGAVARIIEHLPADARSRYFDPKTGVNDAGARLVEGALLSKLLRADDRTLPVFEKARAVVFDAIEQGGEEMRRLTNGLAEAAGQLIKAQERAEAGTVGPEILAFSDDLTPALARILSLRREGYDMAGAATLLDNMTMFDEGDITPIQTHLAKVLANSASQREVRAFVRSVAKAADAGDEGVMPMFEDVRLDYTGVLNDGIRSWNAIRREAGRPELDPFPSTDAPYDTPLTGGRENVDGASTPPVMRSQPLAASEVADEVAARTVGERIHATADRIEDLPDGESITLTDPHEQALAEYIVNNPDEAIYDINDAIETARAFADERPYLHDFHAGLLEEANAGTIKPADWFVLRELSGGLIRRNAEGRYNMALAEWSDPAMGRYATMQAKIMPLVEKLRGRTLVRPDDAATVHAPHPQGQVTPEEFAQDVGPDVPFDEDAPLASALADTTQHTVVVENNPGVSRAIRRAVGAPATSDGKRAILEFNAPDAKVQAERLSALRQQAEAAVGALEQERRDAEAAPETVEATSVFPTDDLRGMWDRLMRSGVDPIAAATGSVEPTGLSTVADAVESIDRGIYKDPATGVGLEPAEAAELRSYLMRLLNGTLEEALGRKAGRKTEAFTARVKPPPDFDQAELQDRAKAIMDELAQQTQQAKQPLEGFEGTQYVPSPPPLKSKAAPGEPITPRLLLTDRFAGDVIPGLTEELRTGRMETVQRRIATSNATRVIDHIVGPRPEKQIRRQAIENFTRGIETWTGDTHDAAAAKKLTQTIEVAFNKWRDYIENTKLGGYQVYRRINLMGPDQMNRLFGEAVSEVYGEGVAPEWYTRMGEAGVRPSDVWRRADNRIRNYIRESGMPLSQGLETLYGKVANLGERPGRYVTVAYHLMRFLGDLRWLALEAVEPMLITLPQGGIKPVFESHIATRGLAHPAEPMGFGGAAQRAAFADYAHWATMLSDTAQRSGVRHRYLIRELTRQQGKGFHRILLDMAEKEPDLVRMIKENGDTADGFLRRLDRDWAMAEQGTKRFATTAEAERFFKPWRDAGFIDDKTFAEYVKARQYTVHPAIEAELKRVVGDPVAATLYSRLAALNQQLFHDLTATFFGQENRSNLQRAVNHPFLYWPVSYQIKATKWLLRFMLEESFGIDTGAATGAIMQRVWDEHRRRMATDIEYRNKLQANTTAYFIAGMLLPITPVDIGVSMSPWLRMITDENYRRQAGIFGWGPFYTYTSLIPRLIAEQSKPGHPLEGELGDRLQQAFPQSFPVIPKEKPGTVKAPTGATSTIDAEQQRIYGGSVPTTVAQPDYPRLP